MEINLASKRYKGNNGLIKFMNLQSVEGIRDGIENGDIPEWLLSEVLVRLSTKHVLRFKLVSKQWLDTILDPSFVRAYISRASLKPQPWTLISSTMCIADSPNSHFLDDILYDDNVYFDQIGEPSYVVLPPLGGGKQAIFGVSNGLVLCCSYGMVTCDLYIDNPVTRQWIALPPLSTDEWPPLYEGPTPLGTGWGFVTRLEDGNSLESCRIVRISMLNGERISIRFEVFLSEIGEWEDFIVCSDLILDHRLSKQSVVLNEILHWIAMERGIIAYDPYKSPDRVRLIAFPSCIINCHMQMLSNSSCDVYQGKLRYFEVYDKSMYRDNIPHISLWILNDYSSGEWCLLHKINYADIQNDTIFSFKRWSLVPIALHPYDPNVMYLQYGNVLVSYDMGNKRIQVHSKFCRKNLVRRRQSWRDYLLVRPPWPISIPSSFSRAANAWNYQMCGWS